jgi:hypothetical protein
VTTGSADHGCADIRFDTTEIAMQGTSFALADTTPDLGLGTWLRRHRDERRAARALARELADYASASDRDDLAALIAGRGVADSEVADVLVRQARHDLFRAH